VAKHFEYIGFSGEFTRQLSQVLASSIRTRIRSGRDVNGNPAPALSKNYARAKQRQGLPPIRNWTWSGATLGALGPVATQAGQLAVGFSNPKAARIAAILNARCQQFGASPTDRASVIDAINQMRSKLVRIAA